MQFDQGKYVGQSVYASHSAPFGISKIQKKTRISDIKAKDFVPRPRPQPSRPRTYGLKANATNLALRPRLRTHITLKMS